MGRGTDVKECLLDMQQPIICAGMTLLSMATYLEDPPLRSPLGSGNTVGPATQLSIATAASLKARWSLGWLVWEPASKWLSAVLPGFT